MMKAPLQERRAFDMSEKDIEKLIEDYQKAKNEISELHTEISVLKR